MICTVENCSKPIWYSYYCESHYRRNVKWGNPIIERLCFDCATTVVDPKVIGNHFYCVECYELISTYGHLLPLTKGQLSNHKLRRAKAISILLSQDFKCALCKETTNDWRIDHNHLCCSDSKGTSCGRCVRGLLCHTCNLMIGWIEKHPNLNVNEYLCGSRVL